MTNRVYFDWAATAPLHQAASAAMAPFFVVGTPVGANANANSLHSEGREAFAALENARTQVARLIHARPDEVFFTGGATEADNTAVLGLALAARQHFGKRGGNPHVLTTAIEHDAVIQPARMLASLGFDVDILRPDSSGIITPASVEAAIRPETVLVSVMLANNEVGSINPVKDIARVVHQAGALIHTDAVQALGKLAIDFRTLDVDAMSLSAHKIGGPKGVGALIFKSGTSCMPLLLGGGQESGMRSGTQNVAGIIGFAACMGATCQSMQAVESEATRLRRLRDLLYAGLTAHEGVRASVPCEPGSRSYLPNIVNVCVPGIESETLILRFDHLGFAVSGGSACSSRSLEPSHVLTALGIPKDMALCSLRISMGYSTTEDDVAALLDAFERVRAWPAR